MDTPHALLFPSTGFGIILLTFRGGPAVSGRRQAPLRVLARSPTGCVQIVIALVATLEGLPLAYEVLPGNTADKTTLREFLERIERQYGKAHRVWLMDRGVPTEEVLAEMRAAELPVHYLVGTPKGRLTRLERHLIAKPWQEARPGVQSLPGEGRGQAVAASRRALRPCREPRPRRQGAGDPSAADKAAVGPAQATLDDGDLARGAADEARRRTRSVAHRLAPGSDQGRRRQRHVQLSARSK
jgi:hypothetical protein